MNTIIYLSRHSKSSKLEKVNNETFLIKNIMNGLSEEGKEKAIELSKLEILKNVDVVYSSNYKRAIETANYIAKENSKELVIDSRFGERIHGIEKEGDVLPKDFETMQIQDENYKFNSGESRFEVTNRMKNALYELVKEYQGKTISITSHSTAITFLLMDICNLKIINGIYNLIFKDKVVLDENFEWGTNQPELFKLTFNYANELINIEYIKY